MLAFLFSSLIILSIGSPVAHAQRKFDRPCGFVDKTEGGIAVLENCALTEKKGGIKISPTVMKRIAFDKDGLAPITSGAECFWLKKTGLSVRAFCFENSADPFDDGFARVIDTKGKMGFMDKKLKIEIAPRFDFAFPFEGGLAKVCVGCKVSDDEHRTVEGGQWALVDHHGKTFKVCSEAKSAEACVSPGPAKERISLGVRGLELKKPETAEALIPKKLLEQFYSKPLSSRSSLQLRSENGKECLQLFPARGDSPGSFTRFDVKQGSHCSATAKLSGIASFSTNSGVFLGATQKVVRDLLGEPKRQRITRGTVAIWSYERDLEEGTPLPYFAQYKFKLGRLVEFSFGFEVP